MKIVVAYTQAVAYYTAMVKTNIEIAREAIAAADAIYAAGQTKSSEFELRIQDYRNSVATNLSPDCQVALLLEDAAKAICQKMGEPSFDEAVTLLESYVEAKSIASLCNI